MTEQALSNDGAPRRPALRWLGGKWLLAPWIVSHFPPHRCYVEPFGGAASVLLRKPRCYAEVYNDLDVEVVNFFGVLRSDRAADLVRAVELTPFSRDEFKLCYEPSLDPVERARRLVTRCFLGFSSNAFNPNVSTGFRGNCSRGGTTPSHDWANYPACLAEIITRFRGVVIENRPAAEILAMHDAADTLFYVDPPYVHSTRSDKRKGKEIYHSYVHEMDDAAHAELLRSLASLRGMVVLSGYPSQLYEDLLPGWRRVERDALADGARPRTEVLWLNDSCGRAGAVDGQRSLPV